jgi:hypothetical protein
MYQSLADFCHWFQNTPYILYFAGSDWAFPFVQLTHFTGLSLWVGTNVILDLRLMGVIKGDQTPAELSDTLFAWNWTGLAIAVLGGVTFFGIAAGGYIVNPAFRVKLGLLIPIGLILHIIVQKKVKSWSKTPEVPSIGKWVGFTEMLLWFGVATAAVLIPYF